MKVFGVSTLVSYRLAIGLVFAFCCLVLVAFAAPVRADVQPVEPPVQSAEPTVVFDATAADPIVRVAAHRRCSSRTVVITPAYTNGTLVKTVLFVNGRMLSTTTDAAARFHLGARRFKAGRNNYEIVSLFTSGKSASTIGSFTRCSRRG